MERMKMFGITMLGLEAVFCFAAGWLLADWIMGRRK
jgi:hypothetical protein